MIWSYRPTRTPHCYELVYDGDHPLGEVRFIEDVPRESLLMEDIVEGLNHPAPLSERGFRGSAREMIERARQRRRSRG